MTLLHDIVVKDSKEIVSPRDISIRLHDTYPTGLFELEHIKKTLTIQCSVALSKHIDLNDRIIELSKKRLVSFVYRDVNKELYNLSEIIISLHCRLMASKDYYQYEELIKDILDKIENINQITHGEK